MANMVNGNLIHTHIFSGIWCSSIKHQKKTAKATKVCIRPKDMTQQAILSYDINANNWFRKKQKTIIDG